MVVAVFLLSALPSVIDAMRLLMPQAPDFPEPTPLLGQRCEWTEGSIASAGILVKSWSRGQRISYTSYSIVSGRSAPLIEAVTNCQVYWHPMLLRVTGLGVTWGKSKQQHRDMILGESMPGLLYLCAHSAVVFPSLGTDIALRLNVDRDPRGRADALVWRRLCATRGAPVTG
jgi:hypothetical protein